MGKPAVTSELTDEQRAELEAWCVVVRQRKAWRGAPRLCF
jgi:hypothetical protein